MGGVGGRFSFYFYDLFWRLGGENAVAAGGPGGGDAAVEALAGLIACEGVAG